MTNKTLVKVKNKRFGKFEVFLTRADFSGSGFFLNVKSEKWEDEGELMAVRDVLVETLKAM